jgi:hypothetical protein
MSVHVDEVATRVVLGPPPSEPAHAGEARLGAAEQEWSTQLRLAKRTACRTEARGFDD